jgi:serine/threonine protein kinase
MKKINSPHVVSLIESFEDDLYIYIVMEYLDHNLL